MILKEFLHFTRDETRSRKDRIKQPSNNEARHGAAWAKLTDKIKLKKGSQQEEKRVKRSLLMWRFFIQAAICDMLNTSTCGVHYETKIKVCCHCCYCYSSDSITGSGAS